MLMAFAIGGFVGLVVGFMADNSHIQALEDENEHLKIKLADAESVKVIEINDHREECELPHYEDIVDFSQKW